VAWGKLRGVRRVERQAEIAAIPQPVIRPPHPYREDSRSVANLLAPM
jgi:hypothetical protein